MCLFFLNDLPPVTFLVFGAVYPFFWHLMPDRWVFVDQVRGVVLQNRYLTLPLSGPLAHNDPNRRHCPVFPHVPSQQSGSGPQYSGPTVKPLNATSCLAPARLSFSLSSFLSRLPLLPPTHTLSTFFLFYLS